MARSVDFIGPSFARYHGIRRADVVFAAIDSSLCRVCTIPLICTVHRRNLVGTQRRSARLVSNCVFVRCASFRCASMTAPKNLRN